MAYGLTVVNDSSYVQIDENYSNYAMVASGTAASGSAIGMPAGYGHFIFMVRAPYGSTLVRTGTSTVTGATWEYQLYAQNAEVGVAGGDRGLRVYNAAGTCSFSSSNRQLRVRYFALRPAIPTAFPFTVGSVGFHPFIIVDSIMTYGFTPVNQNQGSALSAAAKFNADNSVTYSTVTTSGAPPISVIFGGTRPVIHGI
jgi:hypothetical protein